MAHINDAYDVALTVIERVGRALGQEEQSREFLEVANKYERKTDYEFFKEIPEKNLVMKV
ncbi:MAG TPA: hypothetical protein EYP32_02025 [Aquificaceae bacterium]|nr:hypothetical protein [Aquificaceae bacterium]